MRKHYGVAFYRLFFALLVIAAITAQLMHSHGLPRFSIANFFSFFTIESNILGAFVFLVAGGSMLAGKPVGQHALLRGAATFYMTTTGIIYALLLSGMEASLQTTLPWVNTVLHYIMPVAVLADWLVNRPKRSLSFKQASVWLVFPIAYVAYSLIRGSIVGWYPYPFLNPTLHGYGRVAALCVIVAAALTSVVWFLAWRTRWRVKN